METQFSVAAVADALDAEWVGADVSLSGVDSLDEAGPEDLTFCVYEDPDYVRASNAGAVVCPPSIPADAGRALVYADDPKLAFVRVVREFFTEERTGTTVHPTAVVEPGATFGERCSIGAHVYVADCVTIGDDCTVRPGTVLGGAGFGFVRDESAALHRLPHRGSVRIEDDVEIGANTSIDRAVFGETVVGAGTKLSGNVHLAHQVHLGEDTTVAYGCGMAGGVEIGDRVTVHPHVAVGTDVTVGDDAELGMNAGVLDDVPAGTTVVGSPARPVSE